jgi:hypothetical protein
MNNKGGKLTTECGGVSLAGGFDVFGVKALATKTFTLSGHSSLRLKTQIWKIDSWDYEELFI